MRMGPDWLGFELRAWTERIEEYPDDTPFPSALLSGTVAGRRLHVVAAHDGAEDVTYVITTYEPDPAEWDPTFRRRRA